MDENLHFFPTLALVNNAVMTIEVHVSLLDIDFLFFEYTGYIILYYIVLHYILLQLLCFPDLVFFTN